jgi:hypothetical protein
LELGLAANKGDGDGQEDTVIVLISVSGISAWVDIRHAVGIWKEIGLVLEAHVLAKPSKPFGLEMFGALGQTRCRIEHRRKFGQYACIGSHGFVDVVGAVGSISQVRGAFRLLVTKRDIDGLAWG